ncbi:MRG/MORF4L binding protein isoform X2 [Leptinotarsa decemlineata]
MAFICDKFTDNLHKDINPDKVWAHLETMYNLEALDECESIPFPNLEKDFILPEQEFGNLINKEDDEKKLTANKSSLELAKTNKEHKKEEKVTVRNTKERSDSREGRDTNRTPTLTKKDLKKEPEKSNKIPAKRNSLSAAKEDKISKSKLEDTPKLTKRPTRGSLKPNDDSGSSGKSSPVTVITPSTKRRRI